jgi:hypothetical protein
MKTIEKTDGEDLYFFVSQGDDHKAGEMPMIHEVKLRLLSPARCAELRGVLERALKTWEPEKVPGWLYELQDALTGIEKAPTLPKQSSAPWEELPQGLPISRNQLCEKVCISKTCFNRWFCLCLNEDKEMMR